MQQLFDKDMNKIEAKEEEVEVKPDADENDDDAGEENEKAGDEQPGKNKGGEEEKPGAGDGDTEEEAGQDESDSVRLELEAVKEKLKALETPKSEPAPIPTEFKRTEEEWSDLENDTGLSRAAIKYADSVALSVLRVLSGQMNERFSSIERGAKIQAVATENKVSDIKKYEKDVTEFLDNLPKQMQNDPAWIMKAIHYARGKNGGSIMQAAKKKDELNRKVIRKVAQPSGKAGGADSKTVRLTPIERSAAQAVGMSEEEYAKYKKK